MQTGNVRRINPQQIQPLSGGVQQISQQPPSFNPQQQNPQIPQYLPQQPSFNLPQYLPQQPSGGYPQPTFNNPPLPPQQQQPSFHPQSLPQNFQPSYQNQQTPQNHSSQIFHQQPPDLISSYQQNNPPVFSKEQRIQDQTNEHISYMRNKERDDLELLRKQETMVAGYVDPGKINFAPSKKKGGNYKSFNDADGYKLTTDTYNPYMKRNEELADTLQQSYGK